MGSNREINTEKTMKEEVIINGVSIQFKIDTVHYVYWDFLLQVLSDVNLCNDWIQNNGAYLHEYNLGNNIEVDHATARAKRDSFGIAKSQDKTIVVLKYVS